MRVPAADVCESHFQPDASFKQLRDLQQRIAEWPTRVLRAVFGFVLRWIHLLQKVDRFERLFASALQNIIDALIVDGFKASLHARRIRSSANRKISEIRDRKRRRSTLQGARQVLHH